MDCLLCLLGSNQIHPSDVGATIEDLKLRQGAVMLVSLLPYISAMAVLAILVLIADASEAEDPTR
jgi:hypothetical protein